MKTLASILFYILSSLAAAGQSSAEVRKLQFIAGSYGSFTVDNLDNIYLLSHTNQLKKLNANGDSVSVFNDIKKFGAATLLDVSNPVKILLFYKGFSTIVVLDGMLNLKNTIDLRRKSIFNVTAVALSYDGKIWLYDDMDNVLKKLDDDGTVIFKTADFRQVFDKALAPSKIYDQNRYVYLYDSLQGVFVFDYYGAFKRKIDLTGWRNLWISGEYIFGISGEKLYRHNTTTLQYKEFPIPVTAGTYKQLLYKNNKLYILHNEGLDVLLLDAPGT